LSDQQQSSPVGTAHAWRNIAMRVAFDGTDFHGWQTQPDLRTVQATIEQSLRRVCRHQINLTGSGRTDAGVHAAGHVSNFITNCKLPPSKLRHAVGSRLPKDISIVDLHEVHPDFHATQSAVSKLYRYRIFNARHRPVEQFVQRYTYHYWEPLDLQKMRAGAAHMVGTHDFSSMTPVQTQRETMVRTVLRCDVERDYDEVRIDVEGTGFLWRQVRNMVGTLLNVGRGHWPPEHVAEIIASKDRTIAGPTAPARGLCLQWVRYPPELLRHAQIEPTG